MFAVLTVYSFDLFVTCANFNPIEASRGSPNHYFGSNISLDLIKNDETIFRVQNISPRNNNMIQKIESTYGYHTLETKAYHKIINLVNLNNRKIADLLNIKYYISDEDLESKGNFIKVNRNLWKNKTSLPRLWFVPTYKLADNEEEMKALLLSANFDPANEVLLYKDYVNNFNQNKYRNTVNETETKAEIHLLNYQGDNLKANVRADSQGFIVFSQLQYPGWIAFVDGKKTALLPADLSIYAIPISKGFHDIKFEFRSKPLYYGNLISFSTLSLIVLTVMRFKYYESKRKKLTL